MGDFDYCSELQEGEDNIEFCAHCESEISEDNQCCDDRLIEQLQKENEELRKQESALKEWLEQERDDWGSTDKDRTNPFCRSLSKMKELKEGGE